MVSLINFKLVNEDLAALPSNQKQQEQHEAANNVVGQHMFVRRTNSHIKQEEQPALVYMTTTQQHDHQTQQQQQQVLVHRSVTTNKSREGPTSVGSENQQQSNINLPQSMYNSTNNNNNNNSKRQQQATRGNNDYAKMPPTMDQQPADPSGESSLSCLSNNVPSFVVTWRNLEFAIEPKWHQKMANLNPIAALTSSSKSKSAAQVEQTMEAATCGNNNNTDQQQQQQHSRQVTQNSYSTKIVLDKLDGSFKSGELTAILGPSGAGKTTLLDCLTGRRKHGLSGSIRISSSSSPPIINKCHSNKQHQVVGMDHVQNLCYEQQHHQHPMMLMMKNKKHLSGGLISGVGGSDSKQQKQKQENIRPTTTTTRAVSSNGDNLKVSIIPQNDHLMGHLTVYETLNYASKMKNCFDKQFNHQLNIRRVAQQLGLMSCLGTRINKLSGGQYKRVSIAQELLSSPDILILDEPTSGLDAMTCYQTVQVLRKLTDERQASGQNQIAVILTIHQPNSDVFQQFNHVYVVAQGGKCIYEGPPASIESVINRVGIRLPNSYYNPATMIVEIAAGKFGLDAIHKLNSIQKKQYDRFVFGSNGEGSEQNSTGDSAVDCPSSSSSSNDEDDDDDDLTRKQQDSNNNNSRVVVGFVNKGFVMDATAAAANNDDDNNNNNNNNNNNSNNNNNNNNGNGKDVVVMVVPNSTEEDADSVDKIKMMNAAEVMCVVDGEGRRKKRRRTRKRSGDSINNTNNNAGTTNGNNNNNNNNNRGPVNELMSTSSSASTICRSTDFTSKGGSSDYGSAKGTGTGTGGGGGGGNPTGAGNGGREKRLKLNSLKADQKFPFWRHTYLHFHRSWLSIVRDPMLCSMQLALHIIVPLMVSLVYGSNVGKPNACPRAGPMDIMAYALEPTDSALQLQEDLRTTLENIGYIFFKLYGIIFAAMTVTVLTFPLDMHVLVKEFRNGWYGMSSYFLGRTLADIPFQLSLPFLAMSLSYYATGQPYSYMQWRFLSITGILILSSLIAQSQGLLFGAILMDKMKAAVFVAPAATTPIILFAGFLVRTQSIPRYLRPLSNLSYLRYAIEACLISRYGFNQCECDPAMFNQTVPELPPIARSMLDYWLSSFKASASSSGDMLLDGSNTTNLVSVESTTLASIIDGSTDEADKPDLFKKLIDSLAKANSFGRNITSCEQVVPYPMIDYDLKDSQLLHCFGILLFMLVFTRLLTFFIVCFKVKRKV